MEDLTRLRRPPLRVVTAGDLPPDPITDEERAAADFYKALDQLIWAAVQWRATMQPRRAG